MAEVNTQEVMSQMLSKVASSKRFDESKTLTANPSKKSLVSTSQKPLEAQPSQFSFTRSVGDKIMKNPIAVAPLSPGTIMKGEKGEIMKEAPPFDRDPSRQLTIQEYTSIRNSQANLGLAAPRLSNQLFGN